jgi:ankyrin repeat protein
MLQTLLEHRAAIDAQDDAGETALMIAARGGRRQLTEALVRAGARKDLRNCDLQTAADLSEPHPAITEILRR